MGQHAVGTEPNSTVLIFSCGQSCVTICKSFHLSFLICEMGTFRFSTFHCGEDARRIFRSHVQYTVGAQSVMEVVSLGFAGDSPLPT